ncbi:hypothetical protein ACPPVQ_18400 [Diaminobutyricibacter sp. McL0618]|uniref:hypothetical protein n=1 Tax=Leifsonia sp. McL0618 TaxID=3415677 RepID=UPI003CEFFDAB
MRESTPTRRVAAVALCWLPVVAVIASWLLLRERLPEEMATQWSGRKTSGYTASVVVVAIILGVACSAALSATFVRRRRVVFLAAGFGGMGALVWFVLALANAVQPPDVGGWGLLTPFAFAYGFIPSSVIGRDAEVSVEDAHATDEEGAVVEADGPSESVTVEDAVVSPVSAVGATALIGGGLFWGGAASTVEWSSVVLVVCGLIFAEFAILRVRLDDRRFRVCGLIPGLPLCSIDRRQIDDIKSAWISPTHWWGWGYQVGTTGVGLIARKGAGITVRHNGQTLTVNAQRPGLFIAAQRSMR